MGRHARHRSGPLIGCVRNVRRTVVMYPIPPDLPHSNARLNIRKSDGEEWAGGVVASEEYAQEGELSLVS